MEAGRAGDALAERDAVDARAKVVFEAAPPSEHPSERRPTACGRREKESGGADRGEREGRTLRDLDQQEDLF